MFGSKKKQTIDEEQAGVWIGKKVYIKSSTTYVLSGGMLKNRKEFTDRMVDFFGISKSDLDGYAIYSKADEGGFVYYASKAPLSDLKLIQPLKRPYPYYASIVRRPSIILGFLDALICCVPFVSFASFSIAHSYLFPDSYFGVPFILSLIPSFILMFFSLGNFVFNLKCKILDVQTNDHIITSENSIDHDLLGFLYRRFRRIWFHSDAQSLGANLSSYDHASKKQLPYTEDEVVDCINGLTEGYLNCIWPVDWNEIDDDEDLIMKTYENDVSESDKNQLRQDVLDKVKELFPHDSPIVSTIRSMMNQKEMDPVVIAKWRRHWQQSTRRARRLIH